MTQEEKLKKMSSDFSSLSEEKQDYILGILQALSFANSSNEKSAPKDLPNPEKKT
ncbi:hypothetical protein AGMMS50293_00290 [Spirochaetia bacterium]|nr:hypothetical protein AGMMS50293_00290 [Spirochaetia bacterium]